VGNVEGLPNFALTVARGGPIGFGDALPARERSSARFGRVVPSLLG
jgi:hypothetical protein